MSILGGGALDSVESSSSDEEWIISSRKPEQKTNTIKKQQIQPKLTLSEASIRTIRANIPKSNRLPPFQPQQQQLPKQILKTVKTTYYTPPKVQESKVIPAMTTTPTPTTPTTASAAVQPSKYFEDKELEVMCTDMNASLLVTRLISVYKNSEVFIRIREIETNTMSFESRLKDHLQLAKDPSDFILDALSCLSQYFSDRPKDKDLTPKFRRLLATTFCTALARFFATPIEAQHKKEEEEEADLISFEDDIGVSQPPQQQPQKEVDLISFYDVEDPVVNEEDDEDEDDDYDSDNSEVIITLKDIQNTNITDDKYTLTRENKLKLISMIDKIPSPVIVYYAMDVFCLSDLISYECEFQNDGVKLCRALFKHGHYDEYLVCIKKLKLFPLFPMSTIADQLFTAGWGTSLPSFIVNQPELQKELLSFINKQLGYGYAGNLGIVPREKLVDLISNDDNNNGTTPPQLSRLKERKFQKDLVNCGVKILKDANLREEDYYFITLAQRYATLRFILTQRAIQQAEDGDLSIEASSNFNGLIDLVCENDPVLARLAIKELIDTGDTVAPPYFASVYKQQEFYCRYNALPLTQRLLGIVKGEQMSRHRSMFSPKKTNNTNNGLEFYTLPPHVQYKMVDSLESLMHMKDILSVSNICGIDTEWVPTFAKAGEVKTALMQISCDVEDVVFLLDLKTIFEPQATRLYNVTVKILQLFFEDENILKIAYDFGGDFDLLHKSIPSSSSWHVSRLLDLKSIRNMPKSPRDPGETIVGGLTGVATTFLGVKLNKRQQLSNWEKRPLTEEQAIYAACDAYCLLDIYYTLTRLKHPFINSYQSVLDEK